MGKDDSTSDNTTQPAVAVSVSAPNFVRSKGLLALMGVVVLIIIAMGSYAIFHSEKNKAKPGDTLSQRTPLTSQQTALYAIVNGSKSATEKSTALTDLANSAISSDPEQAYAYAKLAVAQKPTIRSYAVLGYSAEAGKHTQAAIDAFHKASVLASASKDPDEQQAAKAFDEHIQELEK